MADEPVFLVGDPETRTIERSEPAWTSFVHARLSLEYPEATWTLRRDPGGFSWRVATEREGEVFLHLFGFTKAVPPLETFLGSQRAVFARTGAAILRDESVRHPSGLAAHAITATGLELGVRWEFHARYLRDDAGIYTLKLDARAPTRTDSVATLDRVFATVRTTPQPS